MHNCIYMYTILNTHTYIYLTFTSMIIDIVVEFMQIISVITINESLMNINERL